VTWVLPNGFRDRKEGWLDSATGKGGIDSEFFAAFPSSCCRRMLIGFDVAAGRKKQAGIQVVNQQDVEGLAIEEDDVGDQMSSRSGRL
jgi:hypothetical protein